VRLAGKRPELASQDSRQAIHLYLANLAATTQQKDEKENGYGNAEQPKKNISGGTRFLYSLGQFHDWHSF
jgi:hypothetical protein